MLAFSATEFWRWLGELVIFYGSWWSDTGWRIYGLTPVVILRRRGQDLLWCLLRRTHLLIILIAQMELPLLQGLIWREKCLHILHIFELFALINICHIECGIHTFSLWKFCQVHFWFILRLPRHQIARSWQQGRVIDALTRNPFGNHWHEARIFCNNFSIHFQTFDTISYRSVSAFQFFIIIKIVIHIIKALIDIGFLERLISFFGVLFSDSLPKQELILARLPINRYSRSVFQYGLQFVLGIEVALSFELLRRLDIAQSILTHIFWWYIHWAWYFVVFTFKLVSINFTGIVYYTYSFTVVIRTGLVYVRTWNWGGV